MSPIEAVAVAFGIVSVYLSTREQIWSWPTAIVNVSLFTVVFFQSRLYADMGLQVIYLVLSVYGWYQWLHGGAHHGRLHVSRASPRLLAGLALVDLAAWIALGTALHRYTNAAIPYLDSLLTTTSLVAQWMMTRKILENWVLWIAVDIVYVPMYVARGLDLTAVNYAVYLVLAVLGFRDWRRSLARDQAAAMVTA